MPTLSKNDLGFKRPEPVAHAMDKVDDKDEELTFANDVPRSLQYCARIKQLCDKHHHLPQCELECINDVTYAIELKDSKRGLGRKRRLYRLEFKHDDAEATNELARIYKELDENVHKLTAMVKKGASCVKCLIEGFAYMIKYWDENEKKAKNPRKEKVHMLMSGSTGTIILGLIAILL